MEVKRIKKVGTAKILQWTQGMPELTKKEIVDYIFMLEKYADDSAKAIDLFISQTTR